MELLRPIVVSCRISWDWWLFSIASRCLKAGRILLISSLWEFLSGNVTWDLDFIERRLTYLRGKRGKCVRH